jgi:hypothetical protein|eukprot:COSAG06_NODE_663_length_13295_cov_33.836945_3_plen_78_part_00
MTFGRTAASEFPTMDRGALLVHIENGSVFQSQPGIRLEPPDDSTVSSRLAAGGRRCVPRLWEPRNVAVLIDSHQFVF